MMLAGGSAMPIIKTIASSLAVATALVLPQSAASQVQQPARATPLILQSDEGERRVIRAWPGHPKPGESFILKIDPKNGGSTHLVLLTAQLAPGKAIDTHRHPLSDEVLLLESGTARVHVGSETRIVGSGSMVFIPANTWVSAENVGARDIRFVAIFSQPGFERFMRAVSAPEGEKNVPLSKAENDRLEREYSNVVIYKQP
jgi:quercetin dioxygenase-like cupin family protein